MLARCSLKWMLARCSCYWTQSDMLPDMAGHPKQRDTHGSGCYGVPGGAGRASSRSSAFPQLPHELVDGGSIVIVTASTCGTGGGEGGFAPPPPLNPPQKVTVTATARVTAVALARAVADTV